ncbi:sugar porter family MFS transporter [Flexivirga sp.]|uniref:sugar porter family MFS transporter n=1 Tax=Flexivirga sp. TaxID=1962927 RepID=UPI003F7F0DA3
MSSSENTADHAAENTARNTGKNTGEKASGQQPDDAVELTGTGTRRIWTWAFIIAVGGFLFGYDTGVISGALLFIKTDFHLSSTEQGAVVSVLLLGAMIGALGEGRVADALGRRKVLGMVGVIFLIGTAVAVFATNYAILLVGRVVLGLAVGGASALVPTYLGELAPAQVRGRVLTLNQLMITIGIMVAYLVNLAFSSIQSWRGMLAVGAVPAVVILVGALVLIPESPSWLLTHDRTDDAEKVYRRMMGDDGGEQLLRARQQELEDEQSSDEQVGWRGLFQHAVRPALIVGVVLAALQQFGGINTIIYYAPTIMEKTGLTASNSIYYSVAVGVINLVMTVVSLWIVGRVGRRKLLLFSMAVMLVTLVIMGLSFVASWSSLLSLVFMVLYIAGFAVGMGPLFWVLIGEIFPPNASATGSSAATAVNWASNLIVSQIFLTVVTTIGLGQTFWCFAVICLFALFFIAKWVPETKGREFPEIDDDLQQRFGREGASQEAAAASSS